MNRRAVITGIGVIAPGAPDTAAFWRNCLEGRASVMPVPAHWKRYADFSSTIWAPLPQLDFSALGFNRVEQMQLDKSSLLALGAMRQALDNAQLALEKKNEKKNTFSIPALAHGRTAVFCGSGIGGLSSLIVNQAHHIVSPLLKAEAPVPEITRQTIHAPARFNPFIVSMTMPNAVSANIGIKYSLHGPNATFCCACAAGTIAIGRALEAVRGGTADVVLCGGAEYLGDEFGGIFRGFDCAGTLVSAGSDPQGANRPFDKKRSGFLFAEGGAAMLVVEELEHARKRNAPIVAELRGFAETFDGHTIMMIDPEGREIKRMHATLLHDAGLQAAQIDYINTHGTGTQLNDEIEARIIDEVFGKRPFVNATKSLIGHTIGAGGALETAITALSIAHKTTHACKNLDDPVRDLNFVRQVRDFPIRKAITQSFAFGGHNAALALQEYR